MVGSGWFRNKGNMQVNKFSSKNETNQVARLTRRFEAVITTAVPVGLFIVVAFWASGTVVPIDEYLQHYGLSVYQSDCLSSIVIISLPFLWIVFDGLLPRATYGMRKRGLRFGNINGGPINGWRCALRIIMGIIFIPLFPASWIIAIMDERNRTIADRVCKTAVWSKIPVGD